MSDDLTIEQLQLLTRDQIGKLSGALCLRHSEGVPTRCKSSWVVTKHNAFRPDQMYAVAIDQEACVLTMPVDLYGLTGDASLGHINANESAYITKELQRLCPGVFCLYTGIILRIYEAPGFTLASLSLIAYHIIIGEEIRN